MKRLFVIFPLVALFYTQVAYYWQAEILQWRLRERTREAWISTLPDSRFQRLAVDELRALGKWQNGDRECWYKGHLYDVFRQETVDGKEYLYCLNDEQEETIIARSTALTADSREPAPEKRDAPVIPGKMGDAVPVTLRFAVVDPPLVDAPGVVPGNRPVLPERFPEIVEPPPWKPYFPMFHSIC